MNNYDNPADKEQVNFLAKMRKDVTDMQNTNQFYRGDWLDIFDEMQVISQTPRVFGFVEGIDPRDVFVLGDPVRWKENSGAWQYGYIFELTSVDFTVINNNYTTTLGTVITDFSRGIVRRPIGHPFVFHNQSTQSNGDFLVSSGSVTAGKCGVDWWMDGAVLNIIGSTLGTGNATVQTSSAGTFGLSMLMPFLRLRNDPNVVGYVNISIKRPYVVAQGQEAIGMCNFTTFIVNGLFMLGIVFYRNTFTNWGSGFYDLEFDVRGVPYNLT